jgi:tetratricopeptide (TPR) repeat protein
MDENRFVISKYFNLKNSLIIFIFLPINLFGQLSQCDKLKKATISYCNKEYTEALENLIEFRKNNENYSLIEEVNQVIGHLYFLVSDYKKSKEELLALINENRIELKESEYNEIECLKINDSNGFNCCRMVSQEPTIHLLHLACIDLYEIYKIENQLDQALKYLKLADEKYIYHHDCLNGKYQQDIKMALRYKEIYLLKSDTNSVIRELSKVLFFYEYGHNKVVESLKTILDEKYSSEEKRNEINKALNSIILKEVIIKDKKYNKFEFVFFGNIVEYPLIDVITYKIKTVDELKNKLIKLDFFMNFGN